MQYVNPCTRYCTVTDANEQRSLRSSSVVVMANDIGGASVLSTQVLQ